MATVLVVDDEAAIRTSITFALEREGHRVVEAENGLEAKTKFERTRFDLAIVDIVMPEVEGIATIRELRRRNPAMKILAISGGGRSGNADYLKIAEKLGADATLSKPFSAADLRSAVEKLLQSSRGQA
jgi:CheY-like chemotaxis protein